MTNEKLTLILSSSPQDIQVEINGKIGEGSSSKVYEGTFKIKDSSDYKKVAIKVNSTKQKEKFLSTESEILMKLDHANIIKCLYSDSEFSVYPLFRNGDLFKHLNQVKPKHTQYLKSIAHYLFRQLLDSLFYLRSQKIFHRDIKLDNILLDDEFNLLLADFDLSQIVQGGEEEKDKEKQEEECKESFLVDQGFGTRNYMAPENFVKGVSKIDGFKADIFSAGVVLFSIYFALAPFSQQASKKDIFYENFRQNQLDYWAFYQQNFGEVIQEDFQTLIDGMMEFNPSQRLDLDQIQSHRWVCQEPISSEDYQSIMREISKL